MTPKQLQVIFNGILYYTHSVPTTFFDHSCRHPQGRVLRRILYKNFWINAQIKDKFTHFVKPNGGVGSM